MAIDDGRRAGCHPAVRRDCVRLPKPLRGNLCRSCSSLLSTSRCYTLRLRGRGPWRIGASSGVAPLDVGAADLPVDVFASHRNSVVVQRHGEAGAAKTIGIALVQIGHVTGVRNACIVGRRCTGQPTGDCGNREILRFDRFEPKTLAQAVQAPPVSSTPGSGHSAKYLRILRRMPCIAATRPQNLGQSRILLLSSRRQVCDRLTESR